MAKVETHLKLKQGGDTSRHIGYACSSLVESESMSAFLEDSTAVTKVTEQHKQRATRSTPSKTTLQLANVTVPSAVRRSSRFAVAALNMRSVRSPLNLTTRIKPSKSLSHVDFEFYPRREEKNLLDPATFKLRGLNRNHYLEQGATHLNETDRALLASPLLPLDEPLSSTQNFNFETNDVGLDSKIQAEIEAARQAAQLNGEDGQEDSFGGDFFDHLAKSKDYQAQAQAARASKIVAIKEKEPVDPSASLAYSQDNKTLSKLGFSKQELESIANLRKRFNEQGVCDAEIDDLDQESISDLSVRFGLGRLGQDTEQAQETIVSTITPSVRGYTYEDLTLTNSKSQKQDGSSYLLDTRYGQSSGYQQVPEQNVSLSTEKSFSDNSFNLAPTALKTNADSSLISSASVLQANSISVDAIEQNRLANLSQSHSEMQENELQFKAGFLKQAHLPGAVLYDHATRLVYVDPSAASLLGIEFADTDESTGSEYASSSEANKNTEEKGGEELYPSRVKFHVPKTGVNKAQASYENVYPEQILAASSPSAWPIGTPEFSKEAIINAQSYGIQEGNLSVTYSDHHFHDTHGKTLPDEESDLQFKPYTNTNSSMTFESHIALEHEQGAESSDIALTPELLLQSKLYQKATLAAKASMEADNLMHATEVEKLQANNDAETTDVVLLDEDDKHDLSNIGKNSTENHGVHYYSVLRLLGRDFAHQFFKYLRYLGKSPACSNPLKCRFEQCPYGREMDQRKARNCPYVRSQGKNLDENFRLNQANDSVSFELEMHQGNNRSFLYVRASAFYSPQGDLLSMSFSLSQQASRDFALLPNVLTDNAICDWDIPSEHYCFSPNYYRMVGYPVNSPDVPTYVPDWINTMVHPEDLCKVYEFHHRIRTMRNHDCFEIYYRLKRADGNYFWCKVTGVVISRDKDGNAMHIIGAFSNINHVVDSYEKIRNKIYTDVLTGLKNRAYMQSRLSYLLHPAHQPLGIIFVDATALKLYNDYLSHTAGDRLLITLTSMLNNSITDPKDLVRLSGDEFVCLIPHCSKERMEEIEGQIIEARRQYNLQAPVRMPVFFSFGSSVLDLNESFYQDYPYLLHLNEEEQVPADVFNEAKELFYVTVQASDLQMQYYKRHNKHNHYDLIKTYIENILKYSISLNDSRMSMNFTH